METRESKYVSEELGEALGRIEFERSDIQDLTKIPGMGEMYSRLTLNLVQDWFRVKHDIHIQIQMYSWSDRTYKYVIHCEEAFIRSDMFILDDEVVIDEYYKVLDKAIHHSIALVERRNSNVKWVIGSELSNMGTTIDLNRHMKGLSKQNYDKIIEEMTKMKMDEIRNRPLNDLSKENNL